VQFSYVLASKESDINEKLYKYAHHCPLHNIVLTARPSALRYQHLQSP
jgi:hypothetical protein